METGSMEKRKRRKFTPEFKVRVPAHADHGFQSKPISDSGRRRSPIPEQADR